MGLFIEKEIKILNVKKKKIIKKLEKKGATFAYDKVIEDIYYDTPDRELAKQNKRIRIRNCGDIVYITMKENLRAPDMKACYESEKEVVSIAAAHNLLTQKGLEPKWKKIKQRVSYTRKGVHFDIDIYADIPPLLEIEAEDKATIYKWVKKLGLNKKTIATFGARGLFKYYKLQHKICYLDNRN